MLKEGRNKGSEGEELAEAVCVGLKSWHLLNRAPASAAKRCQPAPLAWICALPFSLFSPWHFASSLLCAFHITLYQYHLRDAEWVYRRLNECLGFCPFVSFRWKRKGGCEHAIFFKGESVRSRLVPITGPGLHSSEGSARSAPVLLGTRPKDMTLAFFARVESVLRHLSALPRAQSGGARPSCCPPVRTHVCFLKEWTDFRPGAATEEGKKKKKGK